MKTMLSFFTGLCLSISVVAQTVTIQFTGTNKNRNYQAVLDGVSYYSSSTDATGAKKITITTLQPGDHTLAIYRTNNNRYNNGVTGATTSGTAVYTKTFQLRSGYDMNIAIRGTGQVSFTEKRNRNTNTPSANTAMGTAAFNQLLNSVRGKWSQSSRITTIRTAFNISTNYFSTDQVGQLLTLVSSEASRLELAKLVYPRVTDQAQFKDLSELFSTQSYKDNLDAFIRSNGGATADTNYGNRSPISSTTFTTLLQTVNNQYLQAGKVAVVRDALNNNSYYFTTTQLRQLITPITAESDRLTLLKQAYSRTADVAAFNTLSDLLYNQSSRTELTTFISNGGAVVSGNYANRVAISDAEFSRLEMKARLHFRQSSTVADLQAAFSSTTSYYNVLQIRQLLTLVTNEADRLALAKLAFHRVNDPTGYRQLDDVFTTQASRDELARYTQANWF